MESYVHKGIFWAKSNIYDGAFSLHLSHINQLYSLKLPLDSIFFTTHPFAGRKSLLLTIEQFFFHNSKLFNGMASSIKKVF